MVDRNAASGFALVTSDLRSQAWTRSPPEAAGRDLSLPDLLPLKVAGRGALRQAWSLLDLGGAVSSPEAVGVLVLAAWLQDGQAPVQETARRAVREMADLVASGAISDELFASASGAEVLVGHDLSDETLNGTTVTAVHLAGVRDAVAEATAAS